MTDLTLVPIVRKLPRYLSDCWRPIILQLIVLLLVLYWVIDVVTPHPPFHNLIIPSLGLIVLLTSVWEVIVWLDLVIVTQPPSQLLLQYWTLVIVVAQLIPLGPSDDIDWEVPWYGGERLLTWWEEAVTLLCGGRKLPNYNDVIVILLVIYDLELLMIV